MDKSMRDRLITSEKRINEIDNLLLEPETTSDMNAFKKLNKERSQLEPIVNKFHDFCRNVHYPNHYGNENIYKAHTN